MFNLLVSYAPWGDRRDQVARGRMFEYTNELLEQQFNPNGQPDLAALAQLPTVFMQETGAGNDIARVGSITRAVVGRDGNVALEYAYDPDIPPIPNAAFEDSAGELGIDAFEFSRTHWAVKDTDLFRWLVRNARPRRARPAVFNIPEYENIERTLVSAMMPFDPAFDDVYAALRQVAEGARLRCRRADDIWENPAVMQDVVSLIDRSRVVIADCTGRNPNVFYEIGIAHTLGRDVILVTQADADIPFDLRHLRYVRYLNNREGLEQLKERLRPRLADLV